MVYPNDQNPKNLVLFYLLPSVPKAACGKSRPGPGDLGYSEGGQIKTNFSLFFCVFVCANYLWPRETKAPVVF